MSNPIHFRPVKRVTWLKMFFLFQWPSTELYPVCSTMFEEQHYVTGHRTARFTLQQVDFPGDRDIYWAVYITVIVSYWFVILYFW